jgi:hypothetical protein
VPGEPERLILDPGGESKEGGAGLRLHLRHDGQRMAVGVIEEGHPLLHARLVAEDQVRCAEELDTACLQGLVGRANVRNAEVQDGRFSAVTPA